MHEPRVTLAMKRLAQLAVQLQAIPGCKGGNRMGNMLQEWLKCITCNPMSETKCHQP